MNTETINTITIYKQHGTEEFFKIMKWLTKAISKDKTREALQHILVEKDGKKLTLVATDGRRLHIAEINLNNNQFNLYAKELTHNMRYKVRFTAKEINLEEWPSDLYKLNYSQVIPDFLGKKFAGGRCVESGGQFTNRLTTMIAMDLIKLDKAAPLFDLAYLKDALGHGSLLSSKHDDKITWKYQALDEMSPILLTFDQFFQTKLTVVLMPVRW